MAAAVVVFDFDKTIIDCVSDTWVIDSLGFSDLFHRLLPTMPWNTLMDMMMNEVHEQGKTVEDIVEVLQRASIHPRVLSAIRTAHASGFDLKIVSDANSFFIDTILEHHGVRGCFSEIQTNPRYVDEDGRVRIFPCHDTTSSPHGCALPTCPTNMCKGVIVERIRREAGEEGKRVVYLGDGEGDLCPGLKLGEEDHLMPRKGYPLSKLVKSQAGGVVKAMVHEWGDGEELGALLSVVIFKMVTPLQQEHTTTTPLKPQPQPQKPLSPPPIYNINKVVGVSMPASVSVPQ